MQFLDQAKIFVASGAGGNGCISFRREKNIEFGGPNGGNGGRGGDVRLMATRHLNTLLDFRYNQHFKAPKGANGSGSSKAGHAGEDLILQVPVGTEIWDAEYAWMLADLVEPEQELCLCTGGRGGVGNEAFKSSTNRAPNRATPGALGEEKWIILRLKLLADVGLIGLPNAGKSTLLAALTRANPKIGAYPFTTLHPELGLLYHGGREMVLADLPGLIEGAHLGKGLGHRFLGHAERCRVLLHCIDGTTENVVEAYKTIRTELENYDETLAQKPEHIVLTKNDLLSPEEIQLKIRQLSDHFSRYSTFSSILSLSAAAHHGLDTLTQLLFLSEDTA